MSSHNMNRYEPRGERGELLRIIRCIQGLTLELNRLRRLDGAEHELQAKERVLEQLRWRLAVVARRAAANDVGAAA